MSTTDQSGPQAESPTSRSRKAALDRLTPIRGTLTGVGTRYSKAVNLLKYGLPIAALLVILVVIGWPGVQRESDGFRLTFSSFVRDQDGAPGMLNARFVGADNEGRPFLITAESARQNPQDTGFVRLDNLQADMTLGNGVWLTMTASQGDYDSKARELILLGPVDIFSDVGYEFHAGRTNINLKTNEARSDRPVRGQGAFGNIQARSFVISERGQRMKFAGDVKLVVMPGSRQ